MIDVFSIVALALFAMLGVAQRDSADGSQLYKGRLCYMKASVEPAPLTRIPPSLQWGYINEIGRPTIKADAAIGVPLNDSYAGGAILLLDPEFYQSRGAELQLYVSDLNTWHGATVEAVIELATPTSTIKKTIVLIGAQILRIKIGRDGSLEIAEV